jgi:hypothetical protein
MKKHTLAIIFILFFVLGKTNAQNWLLTRYEVHFGLGTTNVFGDIGGASSVDNLYGLKDIKIKDTGPSFYLGVRYKTKEKQAIKFNLIYGNAKSSDVGSKNESRNFSYTTNIIEPSIQYEYYFLSESRKYGTAKLYNRRGMINNYATLSLYAFGGIGGLYIMPKFSGTNISAADKPNNSSSFTAVIPFGLGAKIAYNKFWSFGFEMGRRFTFSDYIDGLNTTYSKANDTYYFSSIHVIYKLECDRYGNLKLFKRRRPRF